jgi:hypothetical protein
MPENIGQKRRESKEEKKQKIRELGFSKEKAIKYLNRHVSIETLQRRIQLLQSLGFTNPIALIEKFPPIAGSDINRVIQSLKSAGFTNPIALIEKFPKIASSDINRVIQSLKSAGFTNPIALIEKHPQIVGYGINHVERRIQLIKKLNTKFQLQLDPIEIIENYPPYLGYDLKRILFYLRIARFYNVDEKFYRVLIKINPFIVFNTLYYSLYPQNRISDGDEFRRLVGKIKSVFPKETRQKIQDRVKTNLPQIIEELKQKQDDPNVRFLLKLASYLEDLLEKERRK